MPLARRKGWYRIMNKVILIGRLTKDPEIRYTAGNNTAVCQFTVAVDRRFKSENQPTADFIPIVAWRQTAEFVSKYFTKGSRIALVGQIQTRSWDDTEGKKHYVTEVIADEVEFCESKKQEGNYQQGMTPPPPVPPQTQQAAQQTKNESGFTDGYFPLDDDGDVPF
jgi:single-strand binding protein